MSFAAAPLLGRQVHRLFACPNAARVSAKELSRTGQAQRYAASEAAGAVETYNKGQSMIHWLMAGGILTCFGTVQASINSKDKDFKGKLLRQMKAVHHELAQMMTIHKSVGLLMAGLIVPRLGYKLFTKAPGHVPGPTWEKMAADVSHNLMYAFMVVMPATGIAMGYYGGKGVPFFGYTIPGAGPENKDGKFAGKAFKVHKKVGQAFEFL
eukprot:scaffold263395_cov33-Prasinocladus_malaysianus.AAC.1